MGLRVRGTPFDEPTFLKSFAALGIAALLGFAGVFATIWIISPIPVAFNDCYGPIAGQDDAFERCLGEVRLMARARLGPASTVLIITEYLALASLAAALSLAYGRLRVIAREPEITSRITRLETEYARAAVTPTTYGELRARLDHLRRGTLPDEAPRERARAAALVAVVAGVPTLLAALAWRALARDLNMTYYDAGIAPGLVVSLAVLAFILSALPSWAWWRIRGRAAGPSPTEATERLWQRALDEAHEASRKVGTDP